MLAMIIISAIGAITLFSDAAGPSTEVTTTGHRQTNTCR
jgi:hypothetical protein